MGALPVSVSTSCKNVTEGAEAKGTAPDATVEVNVREPSVHAMVVP